MPAYSTSTLRSPSSRSYSKISPGPHSSTTQRFDIVSNCIPPHLSRPQQTQPRLRQPNPLRTSRASSLRGASNTSSVTRTGTIAAPAKVPNPPTAKR